MALLELWRSRERERERQRDGSKINMNNISLQLSYICQHSFRILA